MPHKCTCTTTPPSPRNFNTKIYDELTIFGACDSKANKSVKWQNDRLSSKKGHLENNTLSTHCTHMLSKLGHIVKNKHFIRISDKSKKTVWTGDSCGGGNVSRSSSTNRSSDGIADEKTIWKQQQQPEFQLNAMIFLTIANWNVWKTLVREEVNNLNKWSVCDR